MRNVIGTWKHFTLFRKKLTRGRWKQFTTQRINWMTFLAQFEHKHWRKTTSNIIFKLPISLKAIHKLHSIWLPRNHLITFKIRIYTYVFFRGFFCFFNSLLFIHLFDRFKYLVETLKQHTQNQRHQINKERDWMKTLLTIIRRWMPMV